MNFDGAWNGVEKIGGAGIVIKDDAGKFVASFCKNFRDVFSLLRKRLWLFVWFGQRQGVYTTLSLKVIHYCRCYFYFFS